ncbi:hypothetical protein [Cohnella sp. REN36]|uniref:hypothetical protein n=1 Tax=Cohnella sp. REN36 TaxID=2887347 RepID=UPI00271517F9|nr:hypothetical protein [Cohnella sp. REN36]
MPNKGSKADRPRVRKPAEGVKTPRAGAPKLRTLSASKKKSGSAKTDKVKLHQETEAQQIPIRQIPWWVVPEHQRALMPGTGPGAGTGLFPPGTGGTFPPGAGTFPPGTGGTFPPGAGTFPPGTGTFPPGTGMFPPGAGTPGTGTFPPGAGMFPPGAGTFPPGTGTPGTGMFPPGTGMFPPGIGTFSPGTGSFLPGPGMIPPGAGTFPPGMFPPGTFPPPRPGMFPPGSLPPGAVPFPPGSLPPRPSSDAYVAVHIHGGEAYPDANGNFYISHFPTMTIRQALIATGRAQFGTEGFIRSISDVPIEKDVGLTIRMNGHVIPQMLLDQPLTPGNTVGLSLHVI